MTLIKSTISIHLAIMLLIVLSVSLMMSQHCDCSLDHSAPPCVECIFESSFLPHDQKAQLDSDLLKSCRIPASFNQLYPSGHPAGIFSSPRFPKFFLIRPVCINNLYELWNDGQQ